jgi:hypothetical protein
MEQVLPKTARQKDMTLHDARGASGDLVKKRGWPRPMTSRR